MRYLDYDDEPDFDRDDLENVDDIDFADPGGTSALQAERGF